MSNPVTCSGLSLYHMSIFIFYPPLFKKNFDFCICHIFNCFSCSYRLHSNFPDKISKYNAFQAVTFFSAHFFNLSRLSSSAQRGESLRTPLRAFRLCCQLFNCFLLSFVFFLTYAGIIKNHFEPVRNK